MARFRRTRRPSNRKPTTPTQARCKPPSSLPPTLLPYLTPGDEAEWMVREARVKCDICASQAQEGGTRCAYHIVYRRLTARRRTGFTITTRICRGCATAFMPKTGKQAYCHSACQRHAANDVRVLSQPCTLTKRGPKLALGLEGYSDRLEILGLYGAKCGMCEAGFGPLHAKAYPRLPRFRETTPAGTPHYPDSLVPLCGKCSRLVSTLVAITEEWGWERVKALGEHFLPLRPRAKKGKEGEEEGAEKGV